MTLPPSGCMPAGGMAKGVKFEVLQSLRAAKGPNEIWYSPNAPETGGWPDGTGK